MANTQMEMTALLQKQLSDPRIGADHRRFLTQQLESMQASTSTRARERVGYPSGRQVGTTSHSPSTVDVSKTQWAQSPSSAVSPSQPLQNRSTVKPSPVVTIPTSTTRGFSSTVQEPSLVPIVSSPTGQNLVVSGTGKKLFMKTGSKEFSPSISISKKVDKLVTLPTDVTLVERGLPEAVTLTPEQLVARYRIGSSNVEIGPRETTTTPSRPIHDAIVNLFKPSDTAKLREIMQIESALIKSDPYWSDNPEKRLLVATGIHSDQPTRDKTNVEEFFTPRYGTASIEVIPGMELQRQWNTLGPTEKAVGVVATAAAYAPLVAPASRLASGTGQTLFTGYRVGNKPLVQAAKVLETRAGLLNQPLAGRPRSTGMSTIFETIGAENVGYTPATMVESRVPSTAIKITKLGEEGIVGDSWIRPPCIYKYKEPSPKYTKPTDLPTLWSSKGKADMNLYDSFEGLLRTDKLAPPTPISTTPSSGDFLKTAPLKYEAASKIPLRGYLSKADKLEDLEPIEQLSPTAFSLESAWFGTHSTSPRAEEVVPFLLRTPSLVLPQLGTGSRSLSSSSLVTKRSRDSSLVRL